MRAASGTRASSRAAEEHAPDDGKLLLELGGVAIEALAVGSDHEFRAASAKADGPEPGRLRWGGDGGRGDRDAGARRARYADGHGCEDTRGREGGGGHRGFSCALWSANGKMTRYLLIEYFVTWLRSYLAGAATVEQEAYKTDTCRELFRAPYPCVSPVRAARSRKAPRHTCEARVRSRRRGRGVVTVAPEGRGHDSMYGRGRGGRGAGRGTKNVWVRPGATAPAPASSKSAPALDASARAFQPPAAKLVASSTTSSTSRAAPGRDPGAFLPVGVKRKPEGSLNPSAKKFRPAADAAAEAAAAAKTAAKAELEAKLAAAKAQAEARAVLERKEAALAKAERARAASNLLSGFAGARARAGAGTHSGVPLGEEGTTGASSDLGPELTAEELDRIAVRRVMAAGSDWAVLDLAVNAQAERVRRAYRDLARRLHPDKCKAPGAKDAFQKLSRAYQNISANL